MDVSIARVSQIEHGEVASFEVIARYVEALGGRGIPGGRRAIFLEWFGLPAQTRVRSAPLGRSSDSFKTRGSRLPSLLG
jgi:hypothetical protein